MISHRFAGLNCAQGLAQVERLMVRLSGDGDAAGAMVRGHLATGGKRLRARLALAALDVLGVGREQGIGWAAACELLHNATLVHDDLQDGDRTRRGQPTVWAQHGKAQAVNVGDLLLMLPFLALEYTEANPGVRWLLARALAEHAAAVARGQVEELQLAGAEKVGWEGYRRTVAGKTSALFELPVEGAALLAGRAEADARELAKAFCHLGVLFQLQDDVLDLYGDKGRERPGSDLREGKMSALVVEHLTLYPCDIGWLRELLAAPRDATPDHEVDAAITRFRKGGALAAVLRRIGQETEAALGCPALQDEPGLRDLAEDLVEVTLAPIGHLYSAGHAIHG